MTRWRDVDGYEGLYIISDEGEVVSLPRKCNGKNMYGEIRRAIPGKAIKPHLRGKNGLMYPAVTLCKDGISKSYSLHRLLAKAFIPNPDELPEINHKDENTLNYSLDNLEWCTRQYNIDYSKAKRVGQYTLDGEKVAEFKSISYASKLTGISRTAINNALTGWSAMAGDYIWRYEREE